MIKSDATKIVVATFSVLGIWLLYILACLAAAIGVIWVAVHFIHKYW